MWHIYRMEYYSTTKKNAVHGVAKSQTQLIDWTELRKKEIMPSATTWMDLATVLLSEVSQTEEEKYCVTSLYTEPKKKWHKWTYL